MNEKDELQRDMMIEKLVTRHGFQQDQITSIIDKCIQEKGDDACETAYKVFICYRADRIIKDRFTAERKEPNSTKVPSTPSTAVTPTTPKPNSTVTPNSKGC
jgi:hypothetical protein